MRGNRSLFLIVLLVPLVALLAPCPAGAQNQTAPEGKTWGAYNVQQSVEFGYRLSDDWQKGNPRTYDNFVNLHEGPRMLDQTLFMRSLTNDAPLFDTLFISSFGFGGDPNNAVRAKLSKNKWYNFSASFRRDQNFFDYPLFANPLNPTTPFTIPAYPAANTLVAAGLASTTASTFATPQLADSGHPFGVRRRMSDFDLTILPEAVVSVRLGYSRNRITGPSFSSFHEGTDFLIGGGGDNTNTTDNTYRVGADFKLLPKTTISYDQTLDYYKNDTDYNLGQGLRFNTVPLTAAQTMTGLGAFASRTIDFGLPFYGATSNPCGNFFVNTGGQVNPNCSGLWLVNPVSGLPGYYKYQKTRTSIPSEQLSLVSRIIPKVDLTGRYIYSSADMTSPFTEDFYGAVTRTQERRWGQQGTATGRSINNAAEISGTIHVTNKLRVVETFRFNAWRTPITLAATEWSQVPGVIASSGSVLPGTGGATGFTPFLLLPIKGAACAPGDPSATCLTPAQAQAAAAAVFGAHNSSTGADLGNTTTAAFLGQNAKSNTISVEYDFLKQFGARLGYRYGTRRDAEKSGYESATEYYFPNPAGIGVAPSAQSATQLDYRGAFAALRGNCAGPENGGTNTGATKIFNRTPGDVTRSFSPNGLCTATIDAALSDADVFDVTEHTALFGLWYRPSRNLRMNGEVEVSSFDQAVTRISPRHQQHYRFRTTWQPSTKATISFTYNGIENFNPGSVVPPLPTSAVISGTTYNFVPGFQPSTLDIDYKGHSRNFGVSTSFSPSAKVSFDIAYNYSNFQQSNLVCPVYASTTQTSGANAGLASSDWPNQPLCPLFPDQIGGAGSMQSTLTAGQYAGKTVAAENLANGAFTSTNHFVSFFVTWRPVQKVTAQFGYTLSNNNGNMLVLNPWLGVGTPVLNPNPGNSNYLALPNSYATPSSLGSAFHTPSLAVSYEFMKNWTAKAAWTYYAYGENSVATGVGLANDFHANTGLISLRYAF